MLTRLGDFTFLSLQIQILTVVKDELNFCKWASYFVKNTARRDFSLTANMPTPSLNKIFIINIVISP